jgi:hypothetical protein
VVTTIPSFRYASGIEINPLNFPQEEAMSPTLYYETFKTQHEELIRQADHERLIKQALMGQPSTLDRIQTGLGRFLIKSGNHLRGIPAPQKPALNGSTEA